MTSPILKSIAEIEALSEKATPGQWEVRAEVGEGAEVWQPGRGSFFVGLTQEGEPDIADASLIVAAVNFLRTNLPAIKRLAEGSGEPVMWQTRTAVNESMWTDWDTAPNEAIAVHHMNLCIKHGVTCEMRPLYTNPPQAQANPPEREMKDTLESIIAEMRKTAAQYELTGYDVECDDLTGWADRLAALPKQGWLPISEVDDSFPRLVGWPRSRYENSRFDPTTAFKDAAGVWRVLYSKGGMEPVPYRPTHYMPLPPPPEGETNMENPNGLV